MAKQTIIAVAISDNNADVAIRGWDDLEDLKGVRVRPYLRGLVRGLDELDRVIGVGTDQYVIDFRLRKTLQNSDFQNPLDNNPYVILCMSSGVVAAAKTFNNTVLVKIPIIGVVSEPAKEGFDQDTSICGVSARRVQTADKCFKRFKRAVPDLTTVFLLHKKGYAPSERARDAVIATAVPGMTYTVLEVSSASDIDTAIAALPSRNPSTEKATRGIQVLPADLCLGYAREIINLSQGVKKLPAFFPVPDWVTSNQPSAFGAYGVSQRTCGVLMAERVDEVWKNGVPPQANKRWINATNDQFDYVVGTTAAHELNINIAGNIPQV
jgi:ABC-type uncharacterized transport system substrate-binding protein